METYQIIFLILRMLLNIYGEAYNPQYDSFLLTEDSHENIVFIGDFKGVDKVVICDNPIYDYCGLKRTQVILIKGQTQLLVALNIHPFRVPEKFYVHTLTKKNKPTHLVGYKMQMGFFYDRIYPLQ